MAVKPGYRAITVSRKTRSAGLLLLPQAFASIMTALICGRVVDRSGARVVVIPGLVLLAFATWQLSYLTLSTPYGWLQVLFVIRGLGLGLIIQPLSVAAVSDIHPRQFSQSSTIVCCLRRGPQILIEYGAVEC